MIRSLQGHDPETFAGLWYSIFCACAVAGEDMKVFFQSIKHHIQELHARHLKKLRLSARARAVAQRIGLFMQRHPRLGYASLALASLTLLLVFFLAFVFTQTPSRHELSSIRNAVASEVYSADSVLLGRYFIQDRTEVKYEDISPALINALIATEDIRFYKHSGVDLRSLGRVLVKSILLQDESAGGGSTITQQLAKNLYPRKAYWMASMLVNKVKEAIIAMRLEAIYSKQEILALYLNTIPFADNTYGLQSAAKRFFSTTSKDLTLQQAGVLVGMLKATHYYNPRLFPDRARERRNVVFAQMARYGFIEAVQADTLQEQPLELEYQRKTFHEGLAPYFREHVKSELIRWCENHKKADGTPYDLFTDGLKIYTTIDSKLQRYAEQAVEKQMSALQDLFFDHWGNVKPWQGKEEIIMDGVRRSRRYKKLQDEGLSEAEIMEVFNTRVPMRLFTWEGEKEVETTPLDSVKHHLQFLNAGFLAMDPKTGEVKAWVGGINHEFFQYDHVRESTKRQVGSIFKPFVFAAAIDQGVQPCELIPADQETYVNEEGELWTPRNSNYDYRVAYTMRGALAYSVNTVSVKLIHRAGIRNTIALARRVGITSDMEEDPSISLGSTSISIMEMTGAYATLANDGIASYPYFIQSIHDRRGQIFDDFKAETSGERAISSETAQLVRRMLQSVVQEGTASRLRWRYNIYNDVGGKTGTTQENADGWFMAITPKLVIGTWVGADYPRIHFRSTYLGQGSNTALPMVAYFMDQINDDSTYRHIAEARFPQLPYQLRNKLNCDLYELDDMLLADIEKSVWQRDSIMRADTLSAPPPETFLQMLYRRKMRILLASQPEDDSETTTTAAQ